MKRILGALLLTLGLVAGSLQVAGAAAPGEGRDIVRGPAGTCADITGDAVYVDRFFNEPEAQFPRTVFADLSTAQASCVGATYTLSVYATGSPAVLLGSISVEGDGQTASWAGGETPFQVVPAGAPDIVCVQLSSSQGGRIVDLAPDFADGLCKVGTQRNINGGTGASGMR